MYLVSQSMDAMPHLTTAADETWGDPPVDGLATVDGKWRLDLSRYEEYVADTTTIRPTPDLDPEYCYRIGNQLESLLDEQRRTGEWPRGDPDGYPAIESRETVVWLAHFFRRCHEDCRRQVVPPGDDF